ncbi:MAG: hypothetical protein V2A54_12875 [Bacteroidota bacterium]
MKILRSIFLLFSLSLFISVSAQDSGLLLGKVKLPSDKTQRKIYLQLDGVKKIVISDTSGVFKIEKMIAGEHRLCIAARGCKAVSKKYMFRPGEIIMTEIVLVRDKRFFLFRFLSKSLCR